MPTNPGNDFEPLIIDELKQEMLSMKASLDQHVEAYRAFKNQTIKKTNAQTNTINEIQRRIPQ